MRGMPFAALTALSSVAGIANATVPPPPAALDAAIPPEHDDDF